MLNDLFCAGLFLLLDHQNQCINTPMYYDIGSKCPLIRMNSSIEVRHVLHELHWIESSLAFVNVETVAV